MKKFIPQKVRLTYKVTYEVVWVDSFPDGDFLGECRHDQKLIILKRGMSPTLTLQTFIHELIHALEFEHSFKLPHQNILDMEYPLVRLLRLNKWI